MKFVKQRVAVRGYGDCFPACLASLFELPIEVIPNDHSENWFQIQKLYLEQFGLKIAQCNSNGPIFDDSPWIAMVRSKNYNGVLHAIIMQGTTVLWDPSTKERYKKGTYLESENVVGGYIIRVTDFTKLHKLKEYRDKIYKFSEAGK